MTAEQRQMFCVINQSRFLTPWQLWFIIVYVLRDGVRGEHRAYKVRRLCIAVYKKAFSLSLNSQTGKFLPALQIQHTRR
jgi:hypothetical protein